LANAEIITTTTTIGTPLQGAFIELQGSSGYTVTLPSPVTFSGASQTIYNSGSASMTLSTPAGTFSGPAGSSSSTFTLGANTTIVLWADGTNWVSLGASGGPLTATTGTFAGAVTGITTQSNSGTLTLTQTSGIDIQVNSTTDTSSTSTGSIVTTGGVAVNKSLYINAVGNNGVLGFYGSTSGTITFAPPATAGTQSYTLPTAYPGTTGYALVSTTGGTLSWAAAGATITTTSSASTFYPAMASATTGTLTTAYVVSSGLSFVPSTGTLTVTALTESSSITLKENVSPITNALSAIMSLVGVTYDRRDGSRKNEAGLIAEEVYKQLPNLVSLDEAGNPAGIHYSKLTAYLIESIKSLKLEIDQLKGKK
jgi:hypothetical protein